MDVFFCFYLSFLFLEEGILDEGDEEMVFGVQWVFWDVSGKD